MTLFPARIPIIHSGVPSKPYVSLCTIPVKGPINNEVSAQVLNMARKTIHYYSIPRLREDEDIICNIYEVSILIALYPSWIVFSSLCYYYSSRFHTIGSIWSVTKP